MKKALLSLVAVLAIAVSCGSKYPAEMTTLVTEASAKFDSVQTLEQFQVVEVEYATKAQELSAKYAADASQEDLAKVAEIQQGIQTAMEAANQRALAAQAALVADTVSVDSVAVVK